MRPTPFAEGEDNMATEQRTWLTLGILIAAICCVLGSGLLARGALAQGKEVSTTLLGIVGDTMCGNAHTNGPAKQCTLQCLQNKANEWALVVGQRIYTLQGKVADLPKFAGSQAKVTGILRGESLMVTAVSAAQ
jgi:hypothetical protein